MELKANKNIHVDSDQLGIFGFISSFGDCVPLSRTINPSKYVEEVSYFKDKWRHYNPRKSNIRREGLSLTSLDGSMEGIPDLDSIFEFNKLNEKNYRESDFNVPTKAFENITSLSEILKDFENLGRTHILKLGSGGYFPPHRDSFSMDDVCFRVVVPLENCTTNEFSFIVDDKKVFLEQWRAHFILTSKLHSVFSFVENCHLLVMNVPVCKANLTKLIELIHTK